MISIKPLLATERSAVVALNVAANQKGFVAPNRESLDQADTRDFCSPVGIYSHQELVGFAMYIFDPGDGNYWLWRFMIAEQFQGRGYGAAALRALVAQMQALPDCSSIVLGVEPTNENALKLYRRAGFRERGDQVDGETIMVLEF